ncbi:MAG: PAS domain S-box protein, partial [Desulfobacterales bacterium]|nr:PAS domain S-box protein [Desulfobacterales bacterium]
MNIINGLIWWGRIDRDLILIGCVDSLVVTLLISPIAIYLIRHSFNLEEMNQILQKEIEEKQKAKEALKVSEEQYQLLFNSINEVVFSIDINYTITSISPSMEKYLGYMKEDFIGNYLYDLKILPKIYIEKALSQISRVLQGEILESEEYEFFTKDGRIVCAEVSGAPIIINEKIVGMISVARDIT